MGGGAGLGGVGDNGKSFVGGHFQSFEGQVQVPDDRVVNLFGTGVVKPDVVGCPKSAEVVAAGGQLPDEVA